MEVLSFNLEAVFYYGLCSHGVPTTKEPVGRIGLDRSFSEMQIMNVNSEFWFTL